MKKSIFIICSIVLCIIFGFTYIIANIDGQSIIYFSYVNEKALIIKVLCASISALIIEGLAILVYKYIKRG